eukprot:6180367-Pleurochrysis_carterae.AAC.2
MFHRLQTKADGTQPTAICGIKAMIQVVIVVQTSCSKTRGNDAFCYNTDDRLPEPDNSDEHINASKGCMKGLFPTRYRDTVVLSWNW